MKPKKTVNKKPIIMTVAIDVTVCIVAAAVIFAVDNSTKKKISRTACLGGGISIGAGL